MWPLGLKYSNLIFTPRALEYYVLRAEVVSKHLKGQLDPPVSDGNVFASKQVSWTPL